LKLKVPALAGVPPIWPVLPSVIPDGSAPAVIDHVYGATPPAAESDWEYGTFCTALGSEVVITVTGGTTLMVHCFVALEEMSVTRNVKLNAPPLLGVPAIVPCADRVKPGGSCPPAADHAYGGDPPPAVAVELYGCPASAFAAGQLAIAKPETMLSDNNCVVLVLALSVTRTVKLADPGLVGVPAIWPLESVSPGGGAPVAMDQLYGGTPPVAASAAEYGTPVVPPGIVVVPIASGGAEMAMLNCWVAVPFA
jgi:hypothetical protein